MVPSRQANTVHVLNMCAAFAEAGVEVTLIARGDPTAAQTVVRDFGLPRSFAMRLLPRRGPRMLDRLRFLRHVRRSMRGGGFDFAYGRSGFGLLGGVPADVPAALDLHVFPAERSPRLVEARLFARRNFLFATAITKALRDRYEAVYPKLSGRILVAPCAARLPDPADHVREPGPLRVYYVGHLYAGRGIDLILALARLQPQIAFHIVGGEDRDIALWQGQAPHNVLFHGYVQPAELPAHYARADVCIAPHSARVAAAGGGSDIARWMSPMKIFEYMSYGKPVIAADLPVLREILSDRKDAFLCPSDDVGAWNAALEELASDGDIRVRLGRAALKKFEREFTWECRARNVLDKAHSLLLERGPARTA